MPFFLFESVKSLGDPGLEEAKLEGDSAVERFDEHGFVFLPKWEAEKPVTRADVYGEELQKAPNLIDASMSSHEFGIPLWTCGGIRLGHAEEAPVSEVAVPGPPPCGSGDAEGDSFGPCQDPSDPPERAVVPSHYADSNVSGTRPWETVPLVLAHPATGSKWQLFRL